MINKRTAIIITILILLAFFIRIFDVDKPYGTWDEYSRYISGLNYVYNILNLKFDSNSWIVNSPHPPLGKYIYGVINGIYLYSIIGNQLFHLSYNESILTAYNLMSFVSGRIVTILMSVLIVLIIFLIGKKYFNERVGIFSAVILSFIPLFIAHAKLANLDTPLAFFSTLAVFFFIKAITDNRKRYYIFTTVAIGLSVMTKISGVIIFLTFVIMYIFHIIYTKRFIHKVNIFLILTPIIVILMLIVFWPWLWNDPIGKLFSSYEYFNSLVFTEYFFGEIVMGPVYYFIVQFLITTPIILLVLFATGILSCTKFLNRLSNNNGLDKIRSEKYNTILIILWFIVPLTLISLFQSSLRIGGVRYILMIYPPFALIAGIGLDKICKYLKYRFTKIKYIDIILPALLVLYLVMISISIHPYYLDYYNEITGGPINVYENKLFPIGWFGEGIGAATHYLNEYAEKNSTVQFFVMPRHVTPKIRDDMTDLDPYYPDYLFENNIIENRTVKWYMNSTEPTADYLIENTYYRWYIDEDFHDNISSKYSIIYTVEVGGAPLAWVYKRMDV